MELVQRLFRDQNVTNRKNTSLVDFFYGNAAKDVMTMVRRVSPRVVLLLLYPAVVGFGVVMVGVEQSKMISVVNLFKRAMVLLDVVTIGNRRLLVRM